MQHTLLSHGRALFDKLLDVAFIPLLGLILIGRIQDFSGTTIFIILVGVIYTTRNVIAEEGLQGLRLNWLDVSILGVLASEIVNYFGSTYKLNTLASLVDISFLFLLYWIIRVNLKHEYQFISLLLILTVFGVYLTGRVIYTFVPQYQHLTYLQFGDLSNFRERLKLLAPEDVAIAEWITLFLMFLPFPILLLIRYKQHLRVLLLPVVCAVLLVLIAIAISFSRALYLSAFSFFLIGSVLCGYYRLFPLRQLVIFNGILASAFLVIIAVSPIATPVMTTMSILKTSSQMRSLQGRFNTWTTAIDMVRAHPWLGVGSYNFAMQYMIYRPQNTVYVGRALNCFLQILIEKGLLGLATYGFLLVSLVRTSHRHVRSSVASVFEKAVIVLFVTACASAVIRDLSYFSILANKGVAALLCFMFAVNAGLPRTPNNLSTAIKSLFGFLSILALITFALVFLKYTQVSRQEAFQSREDAYYISNNALSLALGLKAKFDHARFRQDQLEFSEEDKARIRSAIDLYNRALDLNPADDCFHHNLGWLYSFLRQPNDAFMHFRKAIDISGDVAVYHVSLGLFYEWTGEQQKALNEYAFAVRLSPAIVDSEFFQDLQSRIPDETEKILRVATRYFEDQLGSGNDPIFNASLGKLYLYKGRTADAIEKLHEATAQLPALSRPWLNLGQSYELLGNEGEARLSYERAVFLNEGDYSAWNRLGDLSYRQQQPVQSIAYYQRALTYWLKQPSIHSLRVFRVYRSKQIVANDILPTDLLAYSEPSFDRATVYSRLAELHRARGNETAAIHFDSLKKELDRSK